MTLNSDFWLNFIFFLLQIVLSIGGIWVGIYLYLRQQQETQMQKYDAIIASLNQLHEELSEVKNKVYFLDVTTRESQKYLLETQREIIISYTKGNVILADVDNPIDKS
jgi:hypothetical protein